MKQAEVVDRDYAEVDNAENDSRKRNTPKIKLTEVSKKMIDSVYAGVRRTEKKLEKVESKIKEAEIKQTAGVELQGIKGYVSFIVTDIKKKILQKKKFKLQNQIEIKNRRAVRIHAMMKKSMLYKYLERLNNLDVNEIDRNSISEAVEKAFDSMSKNDNNSNQNKQEIEKNTVVPGNGPITNDESLKSVMDNDNISESEKPRDRNINENDDEYNEYLKKFYSPEFTTNYNEDGLIEGTYKLRKDEITQDDLAFKNDFVAEKTNVESEFKAPTVRPGFQAEQEKEVEIDSMSIVNDNSNANTVNEELFNKINDSLNDENITSNDLAKLLEELNAVRNNNNKLTEGLDEIVQLDTDMKKQVSAVDQEEREKTELLKEQVEVYKAANSRLKAQIKEVENSVEIQNSILQQKSNNIKLIDEMLSAHTVNSSVTRESNKGK